MALTKRSELQSKCTISIWVLILSNLLVFQFAGYFYNQPVYSTVVASNKDELVNAAHAAQTTTASASDQTRSILAIPQGKAVALPSVRIDESKVGYKRNYYGGEGDKPHLGGFATNGVDMDGVAPTLWKHMIEEMGIKSLLDVGCGRGVSTSWFHMHGVETICVEGSHDAVKQSLLPAGIVTEHDFSRGPWWPERTVDAIWCVELLEHVGRNFHVNMLPAFRKAGIIYASHSTWGGWHHVEVHMSDWWINKFESYGFRYSPELTKEVREIGGRDKETEAPNGKKYNAQHIWLHMLVFINPEVAALPEHHHLFAEGGHGCHKDFSKLNGKRKVVHRPCGEGSKVDQQTESKIPESFLPIKLDPAMDAAWEKHVFGKSTGG